MGHVDVFDPDAGDTITTALLATRNNVGAQAPAVLFNTTSFNLTYALAPGVLDFDTGVTSIVLDFELRDARGAFLAPGPNVVPVPVTVVVLSAWRDCAGLVLPCGAPPTTPPQPNPPPPPLPT